MKYLFLFFIFSSTQIFCQQFLETAQELEVEENSSLMVRVGLPFNIIERNNNFTSNSFLSLFGGAEFKLKLSPSNYLSVLSEFSYNARYSRLKLKLNEKQIIGEASSRINAFSLAYYRDFGLKILQKKTYFSIGPTISQTTIKYDNFERNKLRLEEKNKVTLRQFGFRSSLLLKKIFKRVDLELIYYFLQRTSFQIIEDSSLDTNALKNENDYTKKHSHAIVIALVFRVF